MIRLALVTLLAAIVLTPQTAASQAQSFRSTADVVPLFVTVVEKGGRLVTDLSRDAFQILDNGKPQPITVFDNSPQPVRLIVLLDVSGSIADTLPLLRDACHALVRRLTPGDLARVGTFGQEIAISPVFTRDADALVASLPATVTSGQPTPLWTAIDRAITEFAAVADGRRVVLVLSDGKDTGPLEFGQKFLSQIEIGERAERDDVMIYGVGVRSSLASAMRSGARTLGGVLSSTLPDPGLGTVALDTGGGYLELRGSDDLAATFGRVADELHQQYLLGFTPPARDGKVHKIDVRLRDRDSRARVRKSYRAPR